MGAVHLVILKLGSGGLSILQLLTMSTNLTTIKKIPHYLLPFTKLLLAVPFEGGDLSLVA